MNAQDSREKQKKSHTASIQKQIHTKRYRDQSKKKSNKESRILFKSMPRLQISIRTRTKPNQAGKKMTKSIEFRRIQKLKEREIANDWERERERKQKQ